jgi:N-acetylmuramoyl-L-alanine amidase
MKKRKFESLCYGFIILMFTCLIYLADRSVTVFAENRPVKRDVCIVLDAGHGGIDGGAVSCTGKRESDVNLKITLCLNDLFHLMGYDTKLIRCSDTSVYIKGETTAQKKISDLKERVRIVNETENAILLSIHQNHFPDARYYGAQVFFANTDESEELAKQVQRGLVSMLNPESKRMIRRCEGIYLMDHIKCPGILIECGFLSNPEEEARLQNPEYQQKIASIIMAAVSTYLSNT